MGITVAEQIAGSLADHGVERVFCVPGESFLGVTDALLRGNRVQLVVCRHESGAGYMAIADGQMHDRPGVCMVSRGPGLSNAMIALHTAHQDAVPLVVLIGQIDTREMGRMALQEQNYTRILADLTKCVIEVMNPTNAAEAIGRAMHLARTGTPGAVAVVLPEDVLVQAAEGPAAPPRPRPLSGPGAAALKQLRELLARAERPVLYVGGAIGDRASREAVHALAEKYLLPVCATNRRPHYFDSAHAHYAGYIGIRTPAALLDEIKRCDLLIALGERLTDPVSQSYTFPVQPQPQVPLVHVWPDAEEIGRVWVPRLGIACDPAALVEELNQSEAPALPAADARRAWVAHLHQLQHKVYAHDWEPTEDGVNFAQVVLAINRHVAPDAVITSDAGNFSTFIHRYMRFTRRQTFLSSVVGAMGAGVPMAVAASIAAPKRQVIGYVGDGGALMTGNEIATARLYGARPLLVIADNHAYGTIAMHQRARYPGNEFRPATELHSPDFAAWATAFGARGITIAKPEEVEAKIAEAFTPCDVPTVVHVRVSPTQATAWKRLAQ